ncbi:MAG: Ku protein, partial [Cytophagaceae bacterium]
MPAEPSTRTTWKGAISFGLVHIPITLTSAVKDTREKFRMFDSEGAAPIGYQHVNKLTGQAVAQENIVKGVEVDEGSYVTLT